MQYCALTSIGKVSSIINQPHSAQIKMQSLLHRSWEGETGAEIFPALADGSVAGGKVGAGTTPHFCAWRFDG